MNWRTPRGESPWVSASTDGYYGVSSERGYFEAFHIDALWARPTSIGQRETINAAQRLCKQHAERTPAPV